MKHPPRKSGPTAPPAGLAEAIAAAKAAALDPAAIPALLAAHQGGCDKAAQALTRGLTYLVYEAAAGDHHEWLADLYLGFADAIARLRKRGTDPVAAITAELQRCVRDHYRSETRSVLPNPSTNSSRRKRGDDPHPGLRRVESIERRGRRVDPFSDYATLRDNELVDNDGDADMKLDIEDAMSKMTPLHKNVAGLLKSGMSQREIADSLGMSRAQVRKIIKILADYF